MSYYDGTKLLSLRDMTRRKPEIYISTTNRNAGKTTFFNRYLINRFIKYKEKFVLVYRYDYELDDCANKFFECVKELFFHNHEMKSMLVSKGVYAELFFDGKLCGYAVSLNKSEAIKKCSHRLSTVKRMLFDEFQSENGRYLSKEVSRLLSIHTSLARGGGEQVRYLPLYMLSNTVSIVNPYFLSMGISKILRESTKYLRGDGFVLEQGYYKEVADMQKESGFNRAFASEKYVAYASENVYLNDNQAFIERPKGRSRYVSTISYDKQYSIRYYIEEGIYYMSDSVDTTNKTKLSFNSGSHNIDFILATASSPYAKILKQYFEQGLLRFQNLECKNVFLDMLRYNV